MDYLIPQQHATNLQHLRRFAKPEYLPAWLCEPSETLNGDITPENKPHSREAEDGHESLPIESHQIEKARPPGTNTTSEGQTLYLLICAASVVAPEEVSNIVSSTRAFQGSKHFNIHIITVPATPPTSEEQAKQWSHDYWPTVYKKHNPNGPHPSIVTRAEDEIRPLVGKWMALATQVGLESSEMSIGEQIGAVIVDRNIGREAVVAVVAGDARWTGSSLDSRDGSGNVLAHSVMRAIGLVARKRLMLLQEGGRSMATSKTFLDHPLTQTEHAYFTQDTLKPGGYLCTDLEIYLTHEPCVMCSMAIIHSRFTKVIFGRRMPRTGGLMTEATDDCIDGLRYGLFWLHELNWKMLAWQWIDDHKNLLPSLDDAIHI